ncbi:transmembrane adaptor erv26 [Grosmannia clavigera kw1407]|uniref:Transmembrane adaptor erv26 n=1 Tax=Grosmannia clavigera (strain kw1407 / UAMH 11150) TaxID=655863 RepID=F0XQY7_GROCL|nr:transmembrane adaptor erv26 [Grosmannia clavigera kw1407]EFW99943.1 transmembrane adaptor erv26 [Grosmannia clavigera kw1407]
MSSYYDSPADAPTFTEIASYFGLCVWMVPFALFVSLSASDNVLPTMGSGDQPANSFGESTEGKRGQGMAKAVVDSVLSAFGGVGSATRMKRPEERL